MLLLRRVQVQHATQGDAVLVPQAKTIVGFRLLTVLTDLAACRAVACAVIVQARAVVTPAAVRE
jgi:hypothetical protein